MKHLVVYELEENNIPFFISDGGYFFNENKFIGVTKKMTINELKEEKKVIKVLTKSTFKSYLKKLNLKDEKDNSVNIDELTQIFFDKLGE